MIVIVTALIWILNDKDDADETKKITENKEIFLMACYLVAFSISYEILEYIKNQSNKEIAFYWTLILAIPVAIVYAGVGMLIIRFCDLLDQMSGEKDSMPKSKKLKWGGAWPSRLLYSIIMFFPNMVMNRL